MKVRCFYWYHWFVGIFLYIHVVCVLSDSCTTELENARNDASSLNMNFQKKKYDLSLQTTKVTAEIQQTNKVAAEHADQLKNMSLLNIAIKDLQEKMAIQSIQHDILLTPTTEYAASKNYSLNKRTEFEVTRFRLLDMLWHGQLQKNSVEEAKAMFERWYSWMTELDIMITEQYNNCTNDLKMGNATLTEVLYDLQLLASQESLSSLRDAVGSDHEIKMYGELTQTLKDHCIPAALRYDLLTTAIEPIPFIAERCDTYTSGAMSDCLNEESEQRLQFLKNFDVLENSILRNDSMNCRVSKAEVDFAKCKHDLLNCRQLLENEAHAIENPYSSITDKTAKAIQLYNNLTEIRMDRTIPLEHKVKQMGEMLLRELYVVTDDHLTDRSYELHYLAMEEYVNEATRWLCSNFDDHCSEGKLCGLKPFRDILPSVVELDNNYTYLKKIFNETHIADDLLPYATIFPSVVYKFLLTPLDIQRRDLVYDFSKGMLEDMHKIQVHEVYTTRGDEEVLTKNVAWLAHNEGNSWLPLTPQMRIFISKVSEMPTNLNSGKDAVKTLVGCVCVRDGC